MIQNIKTVFANGNFQYTRQQSEGHKFEVELLTGYAAGVQFEVWAAPFDATGCAPDLTKAYRVDNPFDGCPFIAPVPNAPWSISITAPNVAASTGQIPVKTGQDVVSIPFGFIPNAPYITLKPVGAAVNVTARYVWGL